MGAKVTKDFKDLENLIPKVRREFLRSAKKELKSIIVDDTIKRGNSPVEGEGKFEKYSKSYKEAIKAGRYPGKSVTPVNMTLSGDMLDTFKVSDDGNSLVVSFESDLADIHTNKGAGASKVIRKLLPSGAGDKFTSKILKQIVDLLQDAADKILGK